MNRHLLPIAYFKSEACFGLFFIAFNCKSRRVVAAGFAVVSILFFFSGHPVFKTFDTLAHPAHQLGDFFT